MKYFFFSLLGCVGIAIGHALACLPISIHKASELGKIDDWFNAWLLFVLFLGLPGLVLVELPTALCVYVICLTSRDHINSCLNRLYLVALLLALAVGAIDAICSSSIVRGAIDSLSAAIYFVVIIETARFCARIGCTAPNYRSQGARGACAGDEMQ